MRVAIADDNPVYRAGLVRFVQASGAEVVHEAASGSELLVQLRSGPQPDVAILDIAMLRADEGLTTALEISTSHPDVGVLLLSAYAEASYAERLFDGGSAGKGYMLKDNLSRIADLQEALDRIHRRQTYSDPAIVDMLLSRRQQGHLARTLSPREQKVVALLANGASNAAIAAALSTTTGSIEGTISAVYAKMGMPDTPDYNRRVLIALRWLHEGS